MNVCAKNKVPSSMIQLSEEIQYVMRKSWLPYILVYRSHWWIGRTISLGLLKWYFAVDSQIGRTIIWGQTKPILDKIVKY